MTLTKLRRQPERTAQITGEVRLWGLGARELHDAFWRSRGVQIVRRGESEPLDAAAELWLLVEPGQLVLFDVALLARRFAWLDPLVMRVRLRDESDEGYREQVVTDRNGRVARIDRRYEPRLLGAAHVALTTQLAVARRWQEALTRRAGWQRVRRAVPWARVDHWRLPGRIFHEGDERQERSVLDELVARWANPAQAIDGVNEIEPGVWICADATFPPGKRLGPLWIGHGWRAPAGGVIVGPRWFGDAASREGEGGGGRARVRGIAEVTVTEPAAPVRSHRPALGRAVKRLLDVALSAVALVMLLPAMAMIAILIRSEDGGPAFFAHERQGRGGRPFRCFKFRTMRPDAEALVARLEAYNLCDGPQVFIRDDPRVTAIGRALRRSNLDELPQLVNVLRGEMSLVGPRPSPEAENRLCPAWRDMRLSVRPGITGLWQLHRTRAPGADFQEWIRYDLEYVRTASVRLDLTILARTAWLMVRGRPVDGASR